MPLPSGKVIHARMVGEVADMLAQTKPSLGTIYRRTFSKSAGGGDTEVLTVVATNVPCRIRVQGKRAFERLVADLATDRSQWYVTVPAGTDVRPFDRIVTDGRTFDVRSVGNESYEPEQACLCVEVVA